MIGTGWPRALANHANQAYHRQRNDAKTFSQNDISDATQQAKAYPNIKSLRLSTPPQVTLQGAEDVARKLGWVVVKVSASELRIEATSTSMLFGFKDDIVVRVRESETFY